MRIYLADGFAQARGVHLDTCSGMRQTRSKARVRFGRVAAWTMAELFHQVRISNRVEEARFGRRADQVEVAGIECVEVPAVETAQVAGVVEAPVVDEVHAADDIVPVVAAQDSLELALVPRNEVGFGGQADGDVRRIARAASLDVLDVEVVLPFGHAQLGIASVRRQPVHVQVIGKAELGQAGFDRVLDVALHGPRCVAAAGGVDVIVDQRQLQRYEGY